MSQDRLSFMRFLELGSSDKVPNTKTIWQFTYLPRQRQRQWIMPQMTRGEFFEAYSYGT